MVKKFRYMHLLLMVFLVFGISFTVSAEVRTYKHFHSINATPVNKHPKVLFIGNSHTKRNNMTQTFRKICISAGIEPEIETIAYGGHSISRYMYPESEKDQYIHDELMWYLRKQKWDYIVLQGKLMETENSLIQMEQGIEQIQNLVKDSKTQIVLFMPPETKDPSNRKELNITTRKLYRAYRKLAKKYHIAMAPVSVSYSRVKSKYPQYVIYDNDGHHASKLGSYLTACTLFSTLFDQDADAVAYTGKLSKRMCGNLKKIVTDITQTKGSF